MKKKSTSVFVDGITCGICRLLADGNAEDLLLPEWVLPPDVREGTLLTMTFEISDRKNSDKDEIDRLLSDMPS